METADLKPSKQKRGRSLRFQIGFFYALLATANIIFFSVMIFENQNDLLLSNFKFHSKDLINTVLSDLSDIKLSRERNESYERFVDVLKTRDIDNFIIFDRDGLVWHERVNGKEVSAGESVKKGEKKSVSESLKRKSLVLGSDSSIIRSRYDMELNQEDFTVDLILPLRGETGEDIYLHTSLSVQAIQQSLESLYFQIGLAVIVGVLFHLAFGVFVYRIIFLRVGVLKDTSHRMATGDLSARADWSMRRADELDELGQAFNTMAKNIEGQVDTITRLNEEIQNELEIGKEVQELFLPERPVFTDYDISIYYRPMREVSGDIYSFYQFKNGYRGLFFADATGHGVSAALITTITILSLEDVVRKLMRPNGILAELNNMLSDRLQAAFFATGVFLVFDDQGRIHYSNAGHNAPLYIRPSTGQLLEMEKCGPPLGMMEDFDFEGRLIKARPGDKLLIYSDGLVETKNHEGEQFTFERVKDLISENINKSNEEVVNILSTQLDDFAAEYQDDVSVIMLEIPG